MQTIDIINDQIRSPSIRLIEDGRQIGIINTREAINQARYNDLDLIQIDEQDIPVCIIANYKKWVYEKKVAAKVAAKKQRQSIQTTKELQLRPTIAENDLLIKINHAISFISEGNNVLFKIKLRGREINNKEISLNLSNVIINKLSHIGCIIQSIQSQGKDITFTIGPIKKTLKELS